MRTTLALDDDVLQAARAIAARENKTIGAVVSELARRALPRARPFKMRNGIPQLPVTNPRAVVTLELVNQLRDDDV